MMTILQQILNVLPTSLSPTNANLSKGEKNVEDKSDAVMKDVVIQ